MFSRTSSLLCSMLLALSGVIGACATPADNGGGNDGSNLGAGGQLAPTAGTTGGTAGTTPMAGTTAAGGAGGSTPVGMAGTTALAGAGAGSGGVGGVVAGGAGGAGAGGVGGVAGSAGEGGVGGVAGGTAGSVAMMGLVPKRCMGDGSSVAIIGDSYIALSNEIPRLLTTYSMQTYRNYSVSGTVIEQIQGQCNQATAGGQTETIIMTGGGNNALLNTSCLLSFSPTCKTDVDNALEVLKDLFSDAEMGGVKEIIFFYYPHITGSTNPAAMNEIDDYALPTAKANCEMRTASKCTFIDTRMAFGENSPYFIFDGIHPNGMGSKIIADAIWAVMQENCMKGLPVTD